MAKDDGFVRYTVRVPADLYVRLQHAAGMKSVNAEIVERLQRSFGERPRIDVHDPDFRLYMEAAASYAAREVMQEVMALNPGVKLPHNRFDQDD